MSDIKKVLVLGSLGTDENETAALQRMADFVTGALGTTGAEVQTSFCHIDELGFVVGSDATEIHDMRNNKELSGYDMVFFRGKFGARLNDIAVVANYLNRKNIPIRNSAYGSRRAIGKISQMYDLQALGFPIPYTVSADSRYIASLIEKSQLTYPLILKDIQGAHGNDNYLVHDEAELARILQENQSLRFMAQEFIPNDSDYRVLIVGDKELIIRRKGETGSHLNNTSQGGSATLVKVDDFSKEILKQAHEYAAFCGYEIAGVDAIISSDTGKHYFLEINSQPQIASGAFVDEKAQIVGDYFADILNAK